MHIARLEIPERLAGLLLQQDSIDISSLTQHCRRELGDLPGIGPKSLDIIEAALVKANTSLADDPWGPFNCAREGLPRSDAGLESLFLCDNCAKNFTDNAFRGSEPEFVGEAVKGYCLHCNRFLENIRLRQWYLCGVCNRVVRSIGRSIVADESVVQWWDREVKPKFSHLELNITDPPELRPRGQDIIQSKVARIDFTCHDTQSHEDVFGIELKTGRSHIQGSSIGNRMGQFQLDNSDCDDILEVVQRENMPVYLIHAQVIDRASPPTIYYVAVGLWWTDLFSMEDNFRENRTRPRETRTAAYYDTNMFREMGEFIDHLLDNGPDHMRKRIKIKGIPRLY